MATLHSNSMGGGSSVVVGGAAGGRTSVVRAPISASLPSLFARTLPTQSNRHRQSSQQPASRTTTTTTGGDHRGRLVSTECQTEMEESASVQQNVRVENARNETTSSSTGGAVVVLLDPSGRSRSRPVSQLSESGLSGVEEAVTELERGPPRRRRREKRRHRRSSQVPAQPLQQHVQQALHDQTELSVVVDSLAAPVSPSNSDHLPDILNAHMPPPYSTLPHNSERCMGMGPIPITALPVPLSVVPMAIGPTAAGGLLVPPSTTTPAVVVPAGGGSTSLLASNSFTLPPAGGRRSRGSMYAGEESGKSCCGVMVTQTVSIRWFIVMIAFVGICCAVVGTVLGAMRSSGREHLTVSLLMIGVGIVLITVSTIAWRLTSQDAPSCRAMMGLGGSSMTGAGGLPVAENGECGGAGGLIGGGGVVEPSGRRFLSRIPPTYGRPHHPYAAMMYPEFQYRPPPPSYQASMQEYRLRLLLLDRDRHQQQLQQQQQQQQQHSTPLSRACVAASSVPVAPVSPPPTYRSQANTLIRPSLPIRESEISRPPSYRSRSSASMAVEARNSESQSQQQHYHQQQQQRAEEQPTPSSCTEALIHHQVAMVEAKIKSAAPSFVDEAHPQPSKRDKDNNTVTIVQTNSSSQVLGCHNSQSSPVLVTVTTSPTVHHPPSSSSPTGSQNLQVLAQL